MEIAIFGAARAGQEAEKYYRLKGITTKVFLDNNSALWGKEFINGIKIIGLQDYIKQGIPYHIVLACAYKNQLAIEKQLKEAGISDYEFYDNDRSCEKERIISYCSVREMEDILLYHVLKDEKDIFYIDVGSNDPFLFSVTKLLYDNKNAHGINIEPQRVLWERTVRERPRDISLCVGAGAKREKRELFIQDGGSTLIQDNVIMENCKKTEIEIRTLSDICKEHVPEDTNITLLKIDVEGVEKEVLLGGDFKKYRPKLICVESTVPRTMIPTYENWEYILTDNEYKYIYSQGVNRYYIDTKCGGDNIIRRFSELDRLEEMYNIYHVKLDLVR